MDSVYRDVAEWAFMGITGSALSFAVGFLRKISDSISSLNVQVGILLERTGAHEDRLQHLEMERKQ